MRVILRTWLDCNLKGGLIALFIFWLYDNGYPLNLVFEFKDFAADTGRGSV